MMLPTKSPLVIVCCSEEKLEGYATAIKLCTLGRFREDAQSDGVKADSCSKVDPNAVGEMLNASRRRDANFPAKNGRSGSELERWCTLKTRDMAVHL